MREIPLPAVEVLPSQEGLRIMVKVIATTFV
jgi:hypothetical protein